MINKSHMRQLVFSTKIVWLLSSFQCLIGQVWSHNISPRSIPLTLGVPSELFLHYNQPHLRNISESELTFTCVDQSQGTIEIPFCAVNDDYCDCPDGSDEPGTSACQNGRFFCVNSGYIPAYLKSSRVNDGICDPECCDGSDEYMSDVSCPNRCEDLANLAKEKKRLEYVALKEAISEQQRLMDLAKKDFENKESTLSKLASKLTKSEANLVTIEEDLKAAEQREIDLKTRPLEEFKSSCHGQLLQTRADRTRLLGIISSFELKHKALRDAILRLDTLGDLSNIQMTPEITTLLQSIRNTANQYDISYETTNLPVDDAPVWDTSEYVFRNEMERLGLNKVNPCDDAHFEFSTCMVDAFNRFTLSARQSLSDFVHWPGWKSISRRTRSYLSISGKAKGSQDPSDVVFSLKNQVQSTKDEIEQLKLDLDHEQRKWKVDLGPHRLFASLFGECVSAHFHGNDYELCLFEDVVQKNPYGAPKSLGQFTRWNDRTNSQAVSVSQDESLAPAFHFQMYQDGEGCGPGHARSTLVKFQCGKQLVILSIVESRPCEYDMEVETPLVCNPRVLETPEAKEFLSMKNLTLTSSDDRTDL